MQDTLFYKKRTINCNGILINLDQPIVMGILNITPDSFYDGGQHTDPSTIINKVTEMLAEGATIIDIGGYSTRPNATEITAQEEAKRVIPVIELLKQEFPNLIISIDTFRASVAQKAIHAGASIINDIAGGTLDNKMFETVAQLNVPYVLMHIQGKPQTMQNKPTYNNVVADIIFDLSQKINQLTALGVHDIIIDPGFGFGKTITQNYELLNRLDEFSILQHPILIGVSRKSMIYKPLNTSPKEALNGTTILNTVATQKGASILRVHDVKEAHEVIQLSQLMTTS